MNIKKEGAHADLSLFDGDALENLQLLATPDKNFNLIMNDGKVNRNTSQ